MPARPFPLRPYERPLAPDELDLVLEKEAIERFVARRKHETTHHIRPMHESPPSRMDDDWQPPSQEPPGFTQPDPRTTPVVLCIETRRSTVTHTPIPRPTRQGMPIPGWRKPPPNIEDRDQMIYQLAYEEGIQEHAVIAKKLIERGFEPISPERIGQILRAHSGRDRILRFLAQAPEGKTFTVRDLAQNLSIDAGRIMYVLDTLARRHLVTFRDVRNDGVNSGDHKTKVDIALDRKARRSAAVASVMGREPLSPPTLVPFADQAAADARLHEAEVVYTAKTARPIPPDGFRYPTPDDNELLPTDAGTMSTVEEIPVTSVGPDQQDEAYAKVDEHVAKVVQNARLLQQEINDLGAGEPTTVANNTMVIGVHPDQPTVVLPWIKGSLDGFPVIRALRDRAIKAQKLNAAARILEEVGEDDMVLALMAKTEFSGLETEVIALLHHFGEIE